MAQGRKTAVKLDLTGLPTKKAGVVLVRATTGTEMDAGMKQGEHLRVGIIILLDNLNLHSAYSVSY